MEKKFYAPLLITALLVFVVSTAFRKNENPVKQAWEYKNFSVARNVGGDNSWTSRSEDGVALGAPFTQIPKIKELGEQGWELVSVTSISSVSHSGYEGSIPEGQTITTPSYAGYTTMILYWFKRPK